MKSTNRHPSRPTEPAGSMGRIPGRSRAAVRVGIIAAASSFAFFVSPAGAAVDITQFSPDPQLRPYSVYASEYVNLPNQSGTASGGAFGSGGDIRLGDNISLRSPLLTAGGSFYLGGVTQSDTTAGGGHNTRTRIDVGAGFSITSSNNVFLNAVQTGTLNPLGNDIAFRDSVYVATTVALGGDRIVYNGRVQVGGTFNAGNTGKSQFQAGSSLRLGGDGSTFVGQTLPSGTLLSVAYPNPAPLGNPPVIPQATLPGYNVVGYSPPTTRIDVKAIAPFSHTMVSIKRTASKLSDTLIKTFNCMAALNDTSKCHGDTLQPGYYGNLTVNDNGVSVLLGEGFYSFQSISVGSGSKIIAVQPTGKRTFVYSEGNITASGSGSFYGPADAVGASGYGDKVGQFLGGTFMMMGAADVFIPSDLTVWATISAPRGTVHLSNQVKIYGQVFGKDIVGDNNIDFGLGAYIPFDPIVPVIQIDPGTPIVTREGSVAPCRPTAAQLAQYPKIDTLNGKTGCKDTTIYVTINKTNAYTVGMTYTLVDGSALGSWNWTSANPLPPNYTDTLGQTGYISIPAGQTQAPITLRIFDNSIYQGTVNFQIVLTNPINAKFAGADSTTGRVSVTVLDDEIGVNVSFARDRDTVLKTAGVDSIRINMVDAKSGLPSSIVVPDTIYFDTLIRGAYPAIDPTHYVVPGLVAGTPGAFVVIPAGVSTFAFPVGIVDDNLFGPDRTFRLKIRRPSAGTLSGQDTTTVLIRNTYSAPTISVNDPPAVPEGTKDSFTVTLSSYSSWGACFHWTTSDSTAKAGQDYTAIAVPSVCIPAGSRTVTLVVPTLADNLYEPTEFFKVMLRPDSGITRAGSDTIGVGAIGNTTSIPGILINDTSVVRSATSPTTLTFTVRMIDTAGKSVVSGQPASFGFKLVPISAVPTTDYRDTTGTVTFAMGTDSVKKVQITIPPDSRWYLNPLQFRLVLTSFTGIDTTAPKSKPSGLGSIYAGVGKPVLHVYDSSALEGNTGDRNPIVFRVALLDSTGTAVTSRDPFYFGWSTSDSTAKAGTDYTGVTSLAGTLLAGQKYAYFNTTLIGNEVYQPNRAFGVRLNSTPSGKANEHLTATGTILDDDLPPKVAIDDQTAFRPTVDSSWVFHIALRDPANASNAIASGKPVVVRVRTVDSSAKFSLNDYAAIDRLVVTFNPGEVSKTVSVTVHPDKRFASTLAFKVVLDSLSGATFQDSLGVGTILNSNPRPIIRVGGGRYEEGDTARVSIRLIDPRDSSYTASRVPIPFTWTTKDSTAVRDTDFVWLSRTPDTVKAFAQMDSLLFRMVVHQMSLPQRDFRVFLSPDTSTFQTAGSILDAVVTVWNDYPPPKVWIRSERYPEPVAGDTAKFARLTVSLTAPSGYTNTVVVRTADSTAVAGSNYLAVLDTLVFPPKTTSLSFNVPLRNDGTWDTSKVFKALVVSRGSHLRDSVDGTVTIVNSDLLKVGVTPSFQTVGKDTADTNYAVFHVTLSLPANQTVFVKYATRDSSLQTSGLYQSISGTLAFRPGQVDTVLRVTVPPSNLKLTQANLFVLELDSAKVRLASRDSAAGYSGRTAVVRIFDATNASRFVIDDISTAKRDTIVWFKFHLNRPVASAQTIRFQTVSGTAQGGRDYRDTAGNYVIRATDTTGSIPVHILMDSAYFANPRKFTLSISYGDTFIVLRKPDGIGTITDLTSPPAVSIQDAPAVRETQTAWFPIRTTKPNSDTMRVVWSTLSNSAVAGVNFQGHTRDTLVILPRQTSIQLPIQTLDDGVYDTTLHFQVRIDTVLGGNGQVGSPRAGTGAIFDAGALPGVQFATTDTTVREDLSPDSLWLNVVLTRRIGYAVTVPVRIDSAMGTARVPGNFELPTASVTFPAGKDTVRLLVLIHHDSINTDNLKAVLKLEPNLRDSLTAHSDSIARVTILNVDPPPFVSFRDSLVRIRVLDTTVQIPLRLSRISGKTISGTLTVAGGNARSGIDFDLSSGSFTITPGNPTASVAIQIHDDHRYGPARDLWVHFTPMDTSKVLIDPLTSRQSGDARDTVFHLVLTETTARPSLSFSPTSDTARDADRSADLGVVLSGLSDSVSKAGVVFLDTSKPELRKLHLALVRDTATVDSAKLSTTVRVTWTNDGKVYDTSRTVHLVLRGSVGASIGRDSIVTLVLRNSNRMPGVDLITPRDSSHTNKSSETARWTVDGVEQPTFNTSYKAGWNTVNACYTDASDNRACDSAHVWYDPYPPSVQVFKITGKNPLNPSKDTTWWGDRARTRFGVDTVWYWVRDSIMSQDGKSWRVIVDTHKVVTDLHGDSLFAIPVSASDSVGNTGYDTGWISLKQSIPQLIIQTPPQGAHVLVGVLPVEYKVTDAGKTWTSVGSETVTQPGPDPITRCYTDDVGNKGCDTNTVVVVPNEVVSSYYVDTDGDGKVDAAVVTMESRWTSTTMPSFTFGLNDSIRTNQKPDSLSPFYAGPPRGRPVVVKGDTIWVEAGGYLTDSVGNPLKGPDGKPLTSILGDTARNADGSIMRDSAGRVLYVMAANGKPDSTRFIVHIAPPFSFGQTGFAESQPAVMNTNWSAKDSAGKLVKHSIVDSFKVGDKVPPVILKAEIVRTESYKEQDTLRLVPSEPLNLSSGKEWLEVWRCPGGQTRCDSNSMVWVKVPADSVHKNADGSYWFLVPPGEQGSIRPNYKVRFLSGVSDTAGNGVSKTNTKWSTPVTGAPRPDIVEVTPPDRIPTIPRSEGDRTAPGTIIFKATKGSTVGGKNMQWWEPGKGYAVDMAKVRNACLYDDWCNGPTLYINRPARMIIYIYDMMGTYVTSKEATITQADIDAMQPDQLDRVSVEVEWNHRTDRGSLVATGVYLWRIISYVQLDNSPKPAMTNRLFKVGVKVY